MSSIDDYKLATPPEHDEPERVIDTKSLREALAAGTARPWEATEIIHDNELIANVIRTRDGFLPQIQQGDYTTIDYDPADARLIVLAVNALPGVLDENDRLSASYTSCRDALIAQCRLTADETARAEKAEQAWKRVGDVLAAVGCDCICDCGNCDERGECDCGLVERCVAHEVEDAYRSAPGGETGRE
jgi:hypothetical protein